MPRKLTAESLLKHKSDNPRLDILARKVVLAISERKIPMEEQPIRDDGLAEIFEFSGEWKGMYITARRSKKWGGIFPRFFLEINNGSERYTVKGALASKAYYSSEMNVNKEEEAIDENELTALLASLDGE
jgi:hypothetical protein